MQDSGTGILSAQYLEWLKGNGITWHNVVAAYVKEGWRGIVATADIEPGAVHASC